MWGDDFPDRRARPLSVVILFIALLISSAASAGSRPIVAGESCTAIGVRADVRPEADGPPTEVAVGLRMIDLMKIDDVGQTMTADFMVVQSWADPRLAHLVGCKISLDEVWSPGLIFSNSGRRYPDRASEVGISSGGWVKYVQRYSGTFATYHGLNDFPFDRQSFRVSLISLEWSEDDVRLTVDEKITGRRDLLNVSNWTIESAAGSIGREYFKANDAFHSGFDFVISGQRITGYYLWKVILPLCLIVAMSWSVFWMTTDQHGPQIGISATSMLTLIAFIFATTNMVPALSYLTRLDHFIVGSTVLVFLALVECLTTINLTSRGKEKQAVRIDHVSRWAFPLAFLAITVIAFVL